MGQGRHLVLDVGDSFLACQLTVGTESFTTFTLCRLGREDRVAFYSLSEDILLTVASNSVTVCLWAPEAFLGIMGTNRDYSLFEGFLTHIFNIFVRKVYPALVTVPADFLADTLKDVFIADCRSAFGGECGVGLKHQVIAHSKKDIQLPDVRSNPQILP